MTQIEQPDRESRQPSREYAPALQGAGTKGPQRTVPAKAAAAAAQALARLLHVNNQTAGVSCLAVMEGQACDLAYTVLASKRTAA